MKKENQTKNDFYEKVNIFLRSKYSMITFVSLIIFISLLQILLFIFGVLQVAGVKGDLSDWRPWVYLIISTPGTIASIVGYVYTTRFDKRFFYPTIIGQSIALLTSFVGGIIGLGFAMMFILGVTVTRFRIMNKNENHSINSNRVIWVASIITIIFLIVGYTFIFVPSLENIWFTSPGKTFEIFDVTMSALAIFGSILLIIKSRVSFVIFNITNIAFLTIYVIQGLWLSAFLLAIYTIFNVLSIMSWTHHIRLEKKRALEEENK